MNRLTVARGDGIGPEIMDATLKIIKAAQSKVEFDFIEVGKPVYESGIQSGIAPESWDIIRKNKVLFKAPITTPQGKGYQSLNVAIRKSLGLFANVRECRSFSPFVVSPHPGMDLIIIRENEEDLYAGIEHQQTAEVVQDLKLISRPGCESIVRYAFEYCKAYGRKKVTCMTKDNIMKKTDGLFHSVFDEVSKEYPDIKNDHMIIDIGAAKVAAQPELFDVIVTLNLYGDIISDIAAQVAGSVGLAGSANVGKEHAMFEAVHGSAPDIAGKGVANPSGLINAACKMLVHMGEPEVAANIKNAWLKTLEDGIHTADVFRDGLSHVRATTETFTNAVIARLGQKPETLSQVTYRKNAGLAIHIPPCQIKTPKKELVGVDVFLDWNNNCVRDPKILGPKVMSISSTVLQLESISNRGVEVFPGGMPETYCTDHWRCRFLSLAGRNPKFQDILMLLGALDKVGLEVIKTEHLYTFDGILGFSG